MKFTTFDVIPVVVTSPAELPLQQYEARHFMRLTLIWASGRRHYSAHAQT